MKPRTFLQAAIACLALFCTNAALALPYSSFVVFGDSLSDPGNAFAITTGADPTKPFPPPPYFQGHFSNGITAPEYVAQQSGLPTRNFAQGGATTGALNIDDGRCIPNRDCTSLAYQLTPDLLSGVETQIAHYLGGAPADIGTTLFYLQGGANDFFTDDAALIANIVPNLLNHVARLIGAGAQHIVLSNIPNIARTPFGQALSPGDLAALTGGLALVNGGIAQIWGAFPNIVAPVDSFGLLNAVLDDAAAFGPTNTAGLCRGLATGCDGYAFFDEVHPTTALHSILAREISAATGLPEPSGLALWAIVALGFVARSRLR